jgi:hypothetical protein
MTNQVQNGVWTRLFARLHNDSKVISQTLKSQINSILAQTHFSRFTPQQDKSIHVPGW